MKDERKREETETRSGKIRKWERNQKKEGTKERRLRRPRYCVTIL